MHDHDPWDDEPLDAGPDNRILWPTVRAAAVLLLLAGAVAGGLAYVADPSDVAMVVGGQGRDEAARAGGTGRPGNGGREGGARENGRPADGGREVVVRPGPGGHFVLDAVVNGEPVRFLVDTGATTVALAPDDARRLGFDPDLLDFTEKYQTANGVAAGAPVTLREVRIGQLSLSDVRATVMGAPMPLSLLGLSFLKRLPGHEVRDGKLVLHW